MVLCIWFQLMQRIDHLFAWFSFRFFHLALQNVNKYYVFRNFVTKSDQKPICQKRKMGWKKQKFKYFEKAAKIGLSAIQLESKNLLLSFVARWFGHFEIEYLLFSTGKCSWKNENYFFKIRHVQIDELPMTLVLTCEITYLVTSNPSLRFFQKYWPFHWIYPLYGYLPRTEWCFKPKLQQFICQVSYIEWIF